MDKQERLEEIDRKCRMSGCKDDAVKRHLQLFVYDNWDPHPPPEFVDWLAKFNPTNPDMNPATDWNSDHDRQEFYKWLGAGKPASVPCALNRRQLHDKFKAAMAKIDACNKEVRGRRGLVFAEDTREHGYDQRPTIEGAQPL